MQESFDDGKYTVVFEDGLLYALRYGETWRDLCGDGMVLAMLQEVHRLRKVVKEIAYFRPHMGTAADMQEIARKAMEDIC